jgi:hypothetical protein
MSSTLGNATLAGGAASFGGGGGVLTIFCGGAGGLATAVVAGLGGGLDSTVFGLAGGTGGLATTVLGCGGDDVVAGFGRTGSGFFVTSTGLIAGLGARLGADSAAGSSITGIVDSASVGKGMSESGPLATGSGDLGSSAVSGESDSAFGAVAIGCSATGCSAEGVSDSNEKVKLRSPGSGCSGGGGIAVLATGGLVEVGSSSK